MSAAPSMPNKTVSIEIEPILTNCITIADRITMREEDKIICNCMTVTRGEIIEALQSGIVTFDGLKRELTCSTGCGTCEERVRKIMKEVLEESK